MQSIGFSASPSLLSLSFGPSDSFVPSLRFTPSASFTDSATVGGGAAGALGLDTKTAAVAGGAVTGTVLFAILLALVMLRKKNKKEKLDIPDDLPDDPVEATDMFEYQEAFDTVSEYGLSSEFGQDTNSLDGSPAGMDATDVESEDLMVSEYGLSGPEQHSAGDEVAWSARGGAEESSDSVRMGERAVWDSSGDFGE